MNLPLVHTLSGDIRGTVDDGVDTFRGIPFAAPPVGELRWQAARPHSGWEGVLDADSYGPFASQLQGSAYDPILGKQPDFRTSEDCLTINVWRPAAAQGPLPVLVWIHGGGFMLGSGNMAEYAGDRFARDGQLVVVTLNYRLGPFGFLHGMGDTSNLWLSDQALALRWIHDNIAAFGGDPDNVTLAGQSAGAISIGGLVQHPTARGLFHRAILQSGPFGVPFPGPDEALERTQSLARALGHDSIDGLRGEGPERLLGGMIQVMVGNTKPGQWPIAFTPVIDPDTMPLHPLAALAESDLEILIGWTEDESTFAFALNPTLTGASSDEVVDMLGLSHQDPNTLYDRYVQSDRAKSPFEVLCAVTTDEWFRKPGSEIVVEQSNSRPVYAYEFRLDSQALDGILGSNHCLELPFTFAAADRWSVPSQLDGADPQLVEALSTVMHTAWINFVRTGNPSSEHFEWPAYDSESQNIAVFDTLATIERAIFHFLL
ncbi:para-nitrobenzyl esterase [Rhodococcus fascians]|uniref:carboxylesterase/lipase family protein n=1 Tax=Nocardiaceae TaxID=85025 RepID=UPI0028676362|nr:MULTISPECIES: carboxylesterase family protein [Rhodococcus]MDR6910791.1 para-nitrobenzyl esterase [Rhodococcus sp. 3258]MDR6931842.1 para-nitrobenzyl esterase [Rhodococcus fascians]